MLLKMLNGFESLKKKKKRGQYDVSSLLCIKPHSFIQVLQQYDMKKKPLDFHETVLKHEKTL